MHNDWQFDHVGLVVKDLDEILTYYPQIGIGVNIGPLSPNATRPVPGSPEEEPAPRTSVAYGKPSGEPPKQTIGERISVNRIIDNLQVGSLVIEVIRGRPDHDSFNDRFYKTAGEGISHICFNVPDPEAVTAELVKKGCEIIMSIESRGKIIENYLGTTKYGNIWLSFRPLPEKWHIAWQAHNRAHPLVSGWKFRGMGIATRDLDAAIEYYHFLNTAEFQPEKSIDISSNSSYKVLGLTGSAVKARTRTALLGPVVYEFAQTLEKDTVYGEFLTKVGEGAYSLDFTVDNLERETARLVYRGIKVVFSAKGGDGGSFAYFDTRKIGNLMVKLIQAGEK